MGRKPQAKYTKGPLAVTAAKLRRQAGLTYFALHQASGIDQGTLHRIENGGTRYPTIGTIDKLAKALGVDPSVLQDAAWREHTGPVPTLHAWAHRKYGVHLTPQQEQRVEQQILNLSKQSK